MNYVSLNRNWKQLAQVNRISKITTSKYQNLLHAYLSGIISTVEDEESAEFGKLAMWLFLIGSGKISHVLKQMEKAALEQDPGEPAPALAELPATSAPVEEI